MTQTQRCKYEGNDTASRQPYREGKGRGRGWEREGRTRGECEIAEAETDAQADTIPHELMIETDGDRHIDEMKETHVDISTQ